MFTKDEPTNPLALLQELLAVIHEDGGHYMATHGLKKATADAKKEVRKLQAADVRPLARANR